MLQEEQRDEPDSTCEECDGELHKLIRERINRNFFPSLQALSASYILDHFEIYSDNEGTSPQSVKLLSYNARQSLLELLKTQNLIKMKREPPLQYLKLVDKEYFQKIFATFRQLVGPKCTEFSLDWLLVFCPEPDKLLFAEKALNILALEAPLLESLVVGYESLWVTFNGQIQLQKWKNSSFRLRLFSLHSLKSLKMPGHRLQPEDLILIGQQLPHLEILLCNLYSDESCQLLDATAKMIGNLVNFKHFIFDNVEASPDDYGHDFYHRFCFNNFPQLHTIGLKDREFLRSEFKPIKRQLTRLRFCGGTDLQVLQSVLSNNLMPNVSHLLTTLYHGQTWDPMLLNLVTRFPNISELTLQGIGDVRKFLLAYGSNLLKLTLCHQMYGDLLDVPLEELVELCPKLEELCLSGCQGPAPVIFPNPELHTLDSLTQLKLDSCPVPYPIVSLMMIAPNIKRVTFCTVQPSCEDEIKHLIELVKIRTVCQKLVSLDISLGWNYHDEDGHEECQEVFMALVELAKVMCACVPTLEEVNLGIYVRNFDSDVWDVLFDEDYDFMLPFVNNFCLRKCLDVVDAVHGKYRLRHEWYRV